MQYPIRNSDINRPGIIPAMNNLLTDSPDAIPYIINGMLGGIITPNPPEIATKAVLKILSYPNETKTGIVMLPTAATVAGPDPDIAPKNRQVATTEHGIPAVSFPKNSENTSNILLDIPPLAIIIPDNTNIGTAISGKLSIPPTIERTMNCPLAVKLGSNIPGSMEAITNDRDIGIAINMQIAKIPTVKIDVIG